MPNFGLALKPLYNEIISFRNVVGVFMVLMGLLEIFFNWMAIKLKYVHGGARKFRCKVKGIEINENLRYKDIF